MKALCRKTFLFLLLCGLILLVGNCDKNEPTPSERKLALTFLMEGLSNTTEVFVTDPSGNVLERNVSNGQAVFFTTNPAPYYQVTIIDLITENSCHIKTYQRVPSDSYFIKGPAPGNITAGVHWVSFQNAADYKTFHIQSEHLSNFIDPFLHLSEYELHLTQVKSDLFFILKKDDNSTPRYLTVPGAEVGKATIVNEELLNQFKPMASKVANSELRENYRYKIDGNISESKRLFVSSYEPPDIIFNFPPPTSLYYPETTLFVNYTTQISFDVLKGNYMASVSQIQTAKEPAEMNEQLDTELISYQEADGNYQFSVTGKADLTHVMLHAFKGDKSISWEVYTPFSEQNTISFPSFLNTYLQEKQFPLTNELKFLLIECIDDSQVLFYDDFLRLELKQDGIKGFTKNRLTTRYNLPQ